VRICVYCGKEIKPNESWTEDPVGSGKYWHSECHYRAVKEWQEKLRKGETVMGWDEWVREMIIERGYRGEAKVEKEVEPKACASNYRTFWVVMRDLKEALGEKKWGYARVRLAELREVLERLEKYCGIDLSKCYEDLRKIDEFMEANQSLAAVLTLAEVKSEVERKIEG